MRSCGFSFWKSGNFPVRLGVGIFLAGSVWKMGRGVSEGLGKKPQRYSGLWLDGSLRSFYSFLRVSVALPSGKHIWAILVVGVLFLLLFPSFLQLYR